MSNVNWRELLGWSADQLEELRFTGFTFLREGKYDKALLFFKALTVIDPTSIYDTQTLGALYLQMGQGVKAIDTLNVALNLDPTHEPTKLNKVKALIMLHQTREAITLARALQKSADLTISGDASALLAAYS